MKRSECLPVFLCFYHKTRSFEGKDLERFSRLSRNILRENRVKRSKSLPAFLCFYHKTRSFEGKDLERFSRLSRMRISINRGTKRAIRGSHRKIDKIRVFRTCSCEKFARKFRREPWGVGVEFFFLARKNICGRFRVSRGKYTVA